MAEHRVYRDGVVHVNQVRCATCIFHKENRMSLAQGRVKAMVAQCLEEQTVIPCHATIYREGVEPAVCKGLYDEHAERIFPLRLAKAQGIVRFVPPPPKEGS